MKNNTHETMQFVKWQGVRNCDTNTVHSGWLYVLFLSETTIINVNPNVVKAVEKTYPMGKQIGFSIIGRNRGEAIETFKRDYQICH